MTSTSAKLFILVLLFGLELYQFSHFTRVDIFIDTNNIYDKKEKEKKRERERKRTEERRNTENTKWSCQTSKTEV